MTLTCAFYCPEVMDGDSQVAVEVSQLQKACVVLQQHRGKVFVPTTLSLEEQRLLQSLDRLNQRLQCENRPSATIVV